MVCSRGRQRLLTCRKGNVPVIRSWQQKWSAAEVNSVSSLVQFTHCSYSTALGCWGRQRLLTWSQHAGNEVLVTLVVCGGRQCLLPQISSLATGVPGLYSWHSAGAGLTTPHLNACVPLFHSPDLFKVLKFFCKQMQICVADFYGNLRNPNFSAVHNAQAN